MGRPLPGYDVVLLDPATGEERTGAGAEGELCLRLSGPGGRPVGLMVGYRGDPERNADAMRDDAYHTGDVASRDERRLHHLRRPRRRRLQGQRLPDQPVRARESVLIEHPAVAEAAVVPSPDPTRLAVPKAYVVLAPGHEPDAATAQDILRYARAHLAPYKRIRRIEFAELPKTDLGQDPPGRAARARGPGARRRDGHRRPRQRPRVLGERLPGDHPGVSADGGVGE